MLSRLAGRLRGIDQDDHFGGIVAGFSLAETDGLQAVIVQLKILGKAIADNLRAGFC